MDFAEIVSMAADATSDNSETPVTENVPYSHERMVAALTKMIFSAGFSLNTGRDPIFRKFIMSLNPEVRKVKQRTVLKVARKEFSKLKKEMHATFASLSQRVALACDVWRNEYRWSYIRVTAHWVDNDWTMHRRVISFKSIDELPIIAESISSPIMKSILAWGIRDKVFSVTFDDVCDIAEAAEDIKNAVHPILDGKLFRVRCVCLVLNSCVQVGLDRVSGHITKIRSGVGLPFNDRESFVHLCQKYGLKPKFGYPDDGVSWDCTRDMLKKGMLHKDVLTEYMASPSPSFYFYEITEQDWEVASVYIRFLDVFYEAVDYISRNYTPSSCGVLLHLVNIAKLFSEYRGTVIFEEKLSVVEENFLKHYSRIPDLFCLAAIMDPRIKLSGCECLMESFYECTNNTKINVEEEKKEVSNLLYELFNVYVSQSSDKKQPSSSEPKGFTWSLLRQKRQKITESTFNELTLYLETPDEDVLEMKDFDIMIWWKNHEAVYPVLSAMARDLLTTPVSTLAPDCAFIIDEERTIMDKSYNMSGRLLEMYTCLRDWFNADLRAQGKRDPPEEEEEDDDDDDDDEDDDAS